MRSATQLYRRARTLRRQLETADRVYQKAVAARVRQFLRGHHLSAGTRVVVTEPADYPHGGVVWIAYRPDSPLAEHLQDQGSSRRMQLFDRLVDRMGLTLGGAQGAEQDGFAYLTLHLKDPSEVEVRGRPTPNPGDEPLPCVACGGTGPHPSGSGQHPYEPPRDARGRTIQACVACGGHGPHTPGGGHPFVPPGHADVDPQSIEYSGSWGPASRRS